MDSCDKIEANHSHRLGLSTHLYSSEKNISIYCVYVFDQDTSYPEKELQVVDNLRIRRSRLTYISDTLLRLNKL